MSEDPGGRTGDAPRVLYVDGGGDVGGRIRAAVERVECVPIEATDGTDAIKRFDYDAVDVAVVPAALPDVPLESFLRWADVDGAASPPIVVGDAGDAREPMIQLGGDASVDALAERIERAMIDRRLGDELDRHERLKTAFLRVAGAAVDATDPERVAAVVAEELRGTAAYRSVWLGVVEREGDSVRLTRPIRHGGPPEDVVALLGGEDASFLARAVDSGEVTTTPSTSDPGSGARGGDAVLVAVPFSDGERTHAFAVVETAAADSPDGTERALLGRLGRVCGDALADGSGHDEAATERMRGFFRVVAHELRNPLQVATLSLEAAREEGDEAAFDRLANALDSMESVVETTVGVAVEGGVAEREETGVHEVAVTAWRDVREPPAELTIVEPIEVEADPDQLERLLSNLLRNAIDHAGPDVSVRVGRVERGRGFYVEDDGPGIPPDEREAVFEWGYSTRRDGLGVGLPFVREIAEAHGWTVAVSSRNGGGARFEVTTAPGRDGPKDELTELFERESDGFEFRNVTAE